MKQFRQFPLLAFLLILWLSLTACGETSPSDLPATTEPPAATTEAPLPDLTLVSDGQVNFTIVRGEGADQTTIDAANTLRKTVGNYINASPDLITDWTRAGEEHDPSTIEILVGQTNYPESAEALRDLPYGDYVVTVIGNKIVVNAWSSRALGKGVSRLVMDLSERISDGDCILSRDYRYTGTAHGQLNILPLYENATLSTVYPSGNDNLLLLFDDTDITEYKAYLSALAAKGLTCYAENEIKNNRFDTYLHDKYIISVGYYDYAKQVRLVVEPRGNLPPLETENKYTAVTQPKFAMLGLEYPDGGEAAPQNGQCFIWQLSDGSFLVVDGGFNRAADAKRIYNFMRENAPDPNNITVAAWIITHAHGDHYAAFSQFSYLYCKEVDLALLIVNFISDEGRTAGGLDKSEGASYVHVLKYEKQYRDCKLVTAHVGQKFYLRDAVVEMLYTIESYVPRALTHFNTTSLVFTVDIADQRFLVMGDASSDTGNIINSMYGDYLKSDFIQTAHHGYSTGPNSTAGLMGVYSHAAAPVVLWPVGAKDYANMGSRDTNAHLLKLASTKEIFVAGSRQVLLPLPYTAGTGNIDSIRK